jgi:hypothetical protein
MFTSALSDLSGRVDSTFLTAFLVPALVAIFGGGAIILVHVGPGPAIQSVQALDTMEQGILVLIVLIATLLLAFLLKAVSLAVFGLFAGDSLPAWLAAPLTRSQVAARQRSISILEEEQSGGARASLARRKAMSHITFYPDAESDVGPTRLGNVLAAADDHPRIAYNMTGQLWLPRLMPLLPEGFRDTLVAGLSPALGFLNLALVCLALGGSGAMVFGLLDDRFALAAAVLIAGVLLARWCYLGAVNQATQGAALVRVAFDLYRFTILDQIGHASPQTRGDELALWGQLGRVLVHEPEIRPALGEAPDAPAPAS